MARQWLSEQPDECIVVVTHSGFLNRLVEGPRFRNTEYRTYQVEKNDLGEVALVEVKELSKEIPARKA